MKVKELSAGGVVYRRKGGALEIQMIQDRFGKITLPKGKLEEGETVEQAALREIEEETGIRGTIRYPLEVVGYRYTHPDRGEVDKEVHYFLVEALDGELQAQIEEIRGVEWLSPDEAWSQQCRAGYDNNVSVVEKALLKLKAEGAAESR
ncbi:DNA mismatch repair protein MutT [Paenibacillus sp. J31TS4]|uniref:NUDIX hydrolase n=1 Tax=Paenibacillus sp. J31TS4 TaxID=2807195 RepID=UPI001B269479|nr:NUDIX domain-containing protein [Paenibacillus sp. J31TS4]GIP39592.1 DNA mismatch repair protein MutT [Paenibacillus sp. J31TS4]